MRTLVGRLFSQYIQTRPPVPSGATGRPPSCSPRRLSRPRALRHEIAGNTRDPVSEGRRCVPRDCRQDILSTAAMEQRANALDLVAARLEVGDGPHRKMGFSGVSADRSAQVASVRRRQDHRLRLFEAGQEPLGGISRQMFENLARDDDIEVGPVVLLGDVPLQNLVIEIEPANEFDVRLEDLRCGQVGAEPARRLTQEQPKGSLPATQVEHSLAGQVREPAADDRVDLERVLRHGVPPDPSQPAIPAVGHFCTFARRRCGLPRRRRAAVNFVP